MKNLAAKGLLIAGTSVLALTSALAMPNAANALGFNTWSLSGVNFTNWQGTNSVNSGTATTTTLNTTSGTLTGTFQYDAANNQFANVNLTFAGGASGGYLGTVSENINTLSATTTSGGATLLVATFVEPASTTSSGTATTVDPLIINNTGNRTRTLNFALANAMTGLGGTISVSAGGFPSSGTYFKDAYSNSTTTIVASPFSNNTVTNQGDYTAIASSGGTIFATPVPFEFEGTAGMAIVGGAWILRRNLKKKATKV
jgi:hypothetical protein